MSTTCVNPVDIKEKMYYSHEYVSVEDDGVHLIHNNLYSKEDAFDSYKFVSFDEIKNMSKDELKEFLEEVVTCAWIEGHRDE